MIHTCHDVADCNVALNRFTILMNAILFLL